MRHFLGLALQLALFSGCGPTDPVGRVAPEAVSRLPIVHGAVDTQHAAVVAFIWTAQDLALCSGTLIAPRVVLAAGHCVDQWTQGGIMSQMKVYVGDDYQPGDDLIDIDMTILHPDYQYGPADIVPLNDVALFVLSQEVAIAPMRWLPVLPDDLDGASVTAVGFGVTVANPPGGDGQRRSIAQVVSSVDDHDIFFDGGDGSVCLGDSGGPLLYRDGASDVVIGVHSFTYDQSCLAGGAAARLDTAACFIAEMSGVLLPIAVTISSPANGADAGSAFSVSATADFVAPITSASLSIDGQVVASAGAPPWTFPVAGLAVGTHTLTLTAESGTCGRGSASVSVTVADPDEQNEDGGCSSARAPIAFSGWLVLPLMAAVLRRGRARRG